MNVKLQVIPNRLVMIWLCSLHGVWAAAQSVPTVSSHAGDQREYLATMGRTVEPDLVGRPERLSNYLAGFQQRMINDIRLVAFDAQATVDAAGIVRLTGFVEFPETAMALQLFLETLAFQVDNQLVSVPDTTVQSKPFGLLKQAHCLCYADPNSRREVVTECLLGDPLYLLRETVDETYWCHTAEGYLGYIAKDAVQRLTAEEFSEYQGGPQVTLRVDHQLPNGSAVPVGGAASRTTTCCRRCRLLITRRGDGRRSPALLSYERSGRRKSNSTRPRECPLSVEDTLFVGWQVVTRD